LFCGCKRTGNTSPVKKENAFNALDYLSHLELATEYFVEGNNALRRGDTLMALKYFETAFMLDTNSQILPEIIIEISANVGLPETAIRTILRGRNYTQTDDDELRKIAGIYLRFRAYAHAFEAVSALKEKTKSDSLFIQRMTIAQGLAYMGALYSANENYDSAIVFFDKVLSMGIQTQEILFGIGMASERTGNTIAAEKYFKDILMINPKNALAANYLGYMWAERGINLDQAENLILTALKEEPDNGAFLDSYGWVLFQKDRYEEALPPLLRSAELINDDYVVYYHLGETYLKLGDKQNALKYYIMANTFEDNPDFEKIAEIISNLSK
jgi:tetratricopeptide (TPR) repeat protein